MIKERYYIQKLIDVLDDSILILESITILDNIK